jgi:hypothetical protein
MHDAKTVRSVGIDLEGSLVKRGAQVKNWKQRWFILKSDNLSYYEDMTAARSDPSRPKGSISLVDSLVTSDPERALGFKIVTPDRTYLLEALNDEDARKWVKAINVNRKKLRMLEGMKPAATDNADAAPTVPEVDWAKQPVVTRKIIVSQPAEVVRSSVTQLIY